MAVLTIRHIVREIREDLTRLTNQLMEIEAFLRDVSTGKVENPDGFPRRTHTGTWRGSIKELAAEEARQAAVEAEK